MSTQTTTVRATDEATYIKVADDLGRELRAIVVPYRGGVLLSFDAGLLSVQFPLSAEVARALADAITVRSMTAAVEAVE